MPSRSAAISISGLTKRYGRIVAVDHLDLEVRRGEVFGFLGLNGAGKTTTIRILLDLLRPTSGSAAVFGHDCQSDSLKARSAVGYLPGEMGIYSDLTGHELLVFLERIGGGTVSREHRNNLTERFELSDRDLSRKLREYSTGMKRKLGLIQAFQADPLLLILDVPTEGLDPLMQESFYELLADARNHSTELFGHRAFDLLLPAARSYQVRADLLPGGAIAGHPGQCRRRYRKCGEDPVLGESLPGIGNGRLDGHAGGLQNLQQLRARLHLGAGADRSGLQSFVQHLRPVCPVQCAVLGALDVQFRRYGLLPCHASGPSASA